MRRPTPRAWRLAASPTGRAAAVVAAAVPGATGAAIERRGDLVCVTASAAGRAAVPIALTATSCALDGGL